MNTLSLYFHRICDPDPKCIPDEHERKLQYRRNQNFLTMISIMLILVIIYTLCIPVSPSLADYWHIFVFTSILIVFCLTCRSGSSFFKIFYSICISSAGPIALSLDKQGIFTCWASVHLAPLLLLYYTRCKGLYTARSSSYTIAAIEFLLPTTNDVSHRL